MNSENGDHQNNQPPVPYRRTSDQLVSMQLIGTVTAIVVGVVSFQYQTGRIISEVSAKIAGQDVKIEALQSDIQEVKDSIKELHR